MFDILGGDNALGALVAGQKTYQDFALTPLAKTPASLRLPVPPRLPKADSKERALVQIITALGIPKKGWREVETPDGLDDVIIRKEKLPHIVEEDKGNREQFANYILPTLTDPLEVWLTETERLTRTGEKQRIFRAASFLPCSKVIRPSKAWWCRRIRTAQYCGRLCRQN